MRQMEIVIRLRKENKEMKSLLIKLKGDLNYLHKQKFEFTTPLVLISSRIDMIKDLLSDLNSTDNEVKK